MWGDYANRMWQGVNFMPLGFGQYFYLPYDMNYTPFLYTIGMRLTVWLFYGFTTIWLMSLYLRCRAVCKNNLQKFLLSLLFIIIPFIPHMMAIQGTLMLEYFTLPIILEAIYLTISKNKDKTLFALVAFLAVLIKQSQAIFVGLPLLYLLWKSRKNISWARIGPTAIVASIFFVRLFFETGSPLPGLYNGVFRSPLYPLNNFSQPLFGPQNWWQTLLWPVIGQLGERYAEGIVSATAKIFFAPVSALPYIMALYLAIWRRKMLWALVVASYLLWSHLVGYARYYLPLNILSLLLLVVYEVPKLKLRLSSKVSYVLLMLVAVFSMSSIKTDFSWRPAPSIATPSANFYFSDKYKEGLHNIGVDNLINEANFYQKLFAPYEAVLTVYRGPSTMLSYMGYLNGLPVYIALTPDEFSDIVSSNKIPLKIKQNLLRSKNYQKVLMVVDNTYLPYMTEWETDLVYNCHKLGPAPADPFFQRPDYYQSTTLFECVRRK